MSQIFNVLTPGLLIAFGLVILVIYFIAGGRKRKTSNKEQWLKNENMPKELAGAVLLSEFSEKDLKTSMPTPLHGRPDQVYKTKDGKIIVVDTKTNNRTVVYNNYTIEVSVFAIILKNGYNQNVADYGYIRFVNNNNKVTYKKVKFMSENEIIDMKLRFFNIKENYDNARFPVATNICKTFCGFNYKCRRT